MRRVEPVVQPPASADEPTFILSVDDVCRLCRFSPSHLDRLRRADLNFPKPILLGPRRIGWLRAELLYWLRHTARRAGVDGIRISVDQPSGSIASPQLI